MLGVPKQQWGKFACKGDDLLDYLNKSSGMIVLLLDELNNLASEPSPALATLLRKHFLDVKGRYLCFSSQLVPPP